MSKRKLMQLVNENLVSGWDDPRMPTISGLRRRGVTPRALRDFAYNIGITKYNGITDVAVLEYSIREDLNGTRPAPARRAAPDQSRHHQLSRRPEPRNSTPSTIPRTRSAGKRKIPFSRELYIEQDDFMETPPPKYFRLQPGGEVRLKYAYIIKCDEVVKDAAGQRDRTALHRRSRQQNRRRRPPAAKSKARSIGSAPRTPLTPKCASTTACSPCPSRMPAAISNRTEPALAGSGDRQMRTSLNAQPELRYQFERLGYFTLDPDSTSASLCSTARSR